MTIANEKDVRSTKLLYTNNARVTLNCIPSGVAQEQE